MKKLSCYLALGMLLSAFATQGRGQLAIKGKLLLADDFKSLPQYTKELQPIGDGWQVKATHPSWHLTAEGIESSWAQGHNPVLFYEGPFKDVVVEIDFRFKHEEGKKAYFRLGPANRELDPRAYTVSAWVNIDSPARPPGLVLEHEEWRTQGYTSVITQVAEFKPDTWYTTRLEVIGDTALVSCNGVTISGSYHKFAIPKALLAIGVGQSPHELRHLRIYAATPNPEWKKPDPKDQPTTPIEALPKYSLKPATLEKIQAMTPLFDGKSLEGWMQAPPTPTSFDRREVVDVGAFARRLTSKADPIAAFLAAKLDDAGRSGLAAALAGSQDTRQTLGPVMKTLNAAVQSGPELYDEARFKGVTLRPKTRELLQKKPQGFERARLNRLLIEDAFDRELAKAPDTAWVVKDGVLASTGAGRGVIYTAKDYESYRLIFQVRQNSGPKFDHYPGVLLFCQRPAAGEAGLDALGGLQFGVPSGGHWDYRPGINNAGSHFHRPLRIRYNVEEWSQVEILVDGKTGKARMAVAQPVGTRPVEILSFDDAAAARSGPIALQMHNARLFDEYKNIAIEVDPKEPDQLITLD